MVFPVLLINEIRSVKKKTNNKHKKKTKQTKESSLGVFDFSLKPFVLMM